MPTSTKQPQTKKYFTVQQANATLPLVRVIIRDIVDLARTVQDRQERIDRIHPDPATRNLSEDHREELREVRRQLVKDKQLMREYAAELAQLGVELKDPLMGLVDFPSLHEGREVCLCWMQGEPTVDHWHEPEAGFAGRRSLQPQGRHE